MRSAWTSTRRLILISVDGQTGTPSILDTWAACLQAGPDASRSCWGDELDAEPTATTEGVTP